MKQARVLFSGPLGAFILVIVLMSLAMIVAGASPVDGFYALIHGTLGGWPEVAETLTQTTFLLLPALGICLAFRAGLFNIGAEGQLLIGGLLAGAIGAHLFAPAIVAIPIVLIASMIGGGIWGGIAGWMKARFGANEIIATLMLNFVAMSLANYLVGGPLKSPLATGAETAPLHPNTWLPILLPGTRLSIALLVALAIAVVLQFVFTRTVFGYEVRAIGEAPEAARRNKVNIKRLTWLSLAVSGAIAGLGGGTIVTGELHRFNTELSPGYGFTAIAVALVADLNPLWVCVSAFGFGILEAGAPALQLKANVPKDAIHVIEGLIILVLAARRYISTRKEAAPI
ncbi:MAG TPA: ABC transporter permease [Verrucomicrobiae bacterium]|jgi:simple sugar transport system permease protein|nr:ABC transporter permease [Verrucomicrobiae bacterium]